MGVHTGKHQPDQRKGARKAVRMRFRACARRLAGGRA